MSLFVAIAVAVILLVLVWWLVDSAPFGDVRLKWVLKVLAVLGVIVFIASRMGWA